MNAANTMTVQRHPWAMAIVLRASEFIKYVSQAHTHTHTKRERSHVHVKE